MFGYIKEQINAQRKSVNATTPEMQPADVPNEVITEFAHLFQELDDISEEGIDAGAERKLDLDIDLNGEGDVEVETIEIGLDGNLKDIPGDATAPSITTEYETMKTYDKFYAEAAERIPRMPRESDAAYDKRVSVLADKMYEEYCVDAEEIGAFGFSKMSITDDRVPDRINVNFGSMQDGSNAEFVTKVPVYFATDNNDHQITKKQLDSVRLVQGGAFKNIDSPLKTYMESTYNMPEEKSVWDYCTPSALYVPKGNGDSFCVVLEYTNEITGKNEYFGWTSSTARTDKSADVVLEAKKIYTTQEVDSFIKDARETWKTLCKNHPEIDNKFADQMVTKLSNEVKSLMKNGYELLRVVRADRFDLWSVHNDEELSLSMGVEGDKGPAITVTKYDKNGSWVDDCTLKKLTDSIPKSFLSGSNDANNGKLDKAEKVNMESFVSDIYEWKTAAEHDIAHEAAEMKEAKPKRRLSRFFQEGIDIGTGDAGSDTDNAGGDPPAIDEGSSDQAVDAGTSSDAAPADNPQPDDSGEQKETAAVNDVSDQIAEKVADQTKADATGDEDITFSDEDNSGSTDDSSVSFDSSEPTGDETASVEDQLDDLDNTAAENDELSGDEEGMEDDGSIENGEVGDIENMSMEEIMNNASDKLKSMPLNELKAFLNDNSTSDFQEAFILTKKNINKEVDVHIRKALGILNDNRMNIDKLLSKFKFEGRALNRVLVKAAKTGDVYSSDEQEAIKKLNSALSELLVSLKKTNDSSYVSAVKRKIGDFTKQSKIVAAFVEDKMEKPVQESFLLSNIKDKITKALIPVKADMKDLFDKFQVSQLTRGRIIKKYSSNSYGGTGRSSNMGATTDAITGYSKAAKNIDSALKLLNKAIRKNADDVELITKLADKIDLVSDYIETVIDDKVENKEYINLIGKLSGEIVDLINQYIGDDESLQNSEDSAAEMNEAEPSFDNDISSDDTDADEAVEETPDTDDEESTDNDESDEDNDSEEDDE